MIPRETMVSTVSVKQRLLREERSGHWPMQRPSDAWLEHTVHNILHKRLCVYIYMYMHIKIIIYIHMYVCMCVCMFICICMCVFIYIHIVCHLVWKMCYVNGFGLQVSGPGRSRNSDSGMFRVSDLIRRIEIS